MRSDRPLRNVGRLISGVERNIQSGLLGVPVEEFELDLDHVVEALAPLVDVVVAARDCGALRRRPEPPISECRITVIMSTSSRVRL